MLASVKAYLGFGAALALVALIAYLWWSATSAEEARLQAQIRGLEERALQAERAVATSEQLRRDEAVLARALKEDLDASLARADELDRRAAALPALGERVRRAEASALSCGSRLVASDAAAAAAIRAADAAAELHAGLRERIGAEHADRARFAERAAAAAEGCAASYKREQQRLDALATLAE